MEIVLSPDVYNFWVLDGGTEVLPANDDGAVSMAF